MRVAPIEAVFSLSSQENNGPGFESVTYSYSNGSVKVPTPWKRGRPKGSTNKTKNRNEISQDTVHPQFEFVNTTKNSKEIGTQSRALIRKHVRLQGNSWKGHQDGVTARIEEPGRMDSNCQLSREKWKCSPMQIPGVDPFDTLPIKLSPHMHDVLHHFATKTWQKFYTLEDLAGCNPVIEYWLPLAFNDPALLHSFLGCAEVHKSGYMTIKEGSAGLKHMHVAISMINKQLTAGIENVSHGILAVIAGVALLEKGVGRHDHWRIHMRGLKQLLDLSGGLEALASEPLLLNKIYRADLYGSLDAAEAPYLTRHLPLLSSFPPGHPFKSTGCNDIDNAIALDETLRACIHHFEAAMLFWTKREISSPALETPGHEKKICRSRKPSPTEAAQVRFLLTNIQYTLVSTNYLQTNDDVFETTFFEFSRITLIIYSLTILSERPDSTSVGQQVAKTFRSLVIELIPTLKYDSHEPTTESWSLPIPVDFFLWAIFLTASVFMKGDCETTEWLLLSFVKLMAFLPDEGNDSDEVRARLSQYLWLHSIHNSCFMWLWSKVKDLRLKIGMPCVL